MSGVKLSNVKLTAVSNCPGVKLSAVSNFPGLPLWFASFFHPVKHCFGGVTVRCWRSGHKQKPKTGTVYIHTYMYVPEISLYYTHRSNINARICGPRRSLVVQLIVSRPSPPDFFLPVRHAIDHLLYKSKLKKKIYKILKPNILILYSVKQCKRYRI